MWRHVLKYRNPQLYRCEHLKTRVAVLPEIYNGTLLWRMTVENLRLYNQHDTVVIILRELSNLYKEFCSGMWLLFGQLINSLLYGTRIFTHLHYLTLLRTRSLYKFCDDSLFASSMRLLLFHNQWPEYIPCLRNSCCVYPPSHAAPAAVNSPI